MQKLKSKEQQRRIYQSHRTSSLSTRDLLSVNRERSDRNNSQQQGNNSSNDKNLNNLNNKNSSSAAAVAGTTTSSLRYEAPTFIMPGEQFVSNEIFTPHRQQLGLRLFPRVSQLR